MDFKDISTLQTSRNEGRRRAVQGMVGGRVRIFGHD